ncbi:unnamed protein product [Blepharisma stoltei]|uniref:HECT-type E3 ubiquitin transferase n=1 Tax=Blepharisma stoltei TaxID=1481888 RepID=A0AAU9KAG6_9CILI|nr:unnamed protein product [Blepharisma stoltei]
MGCCISKPGRTQSIHISIPQSRGPTQEIPELPRSSTLPHRARANENPTYFICPYCLGEFRESITLQGFTDHLLFCIRNGPISNSAPKKQFSHLSKESPYITKIEWFRDQINGIRIPWQSESMKLIIQRDNFLITSMAHLLTYTIQDLHKEFQITFEGELGMDAGGVLREWLTLLMKTLFSTDHGLFQFTNSKCLSYTFPDVIDKARSDEYVFMGKLMGKALFENIPINCQLSRIIFKHIVEEEIVLGDLTFVDEDLYRSLIFIRENPIEDVFFETFQVQKPKDKFILKEGGENEKVTEESKQEYIDLRFRFETQDLIKQGLELIMQGFYSVIPKPLIIFFTAEELELALCGLPYIDIQDWQEFTEYRDEFSVNHQDVKWFWEIIESFTQEQLSDLLMFVTGTPRLPVEGFSSLRTIRGDAARFTLEPMNYEENKLTLPRAHTCFNRLDLPRYPSKEIMEKGLLYVLNNHALGFGNE